MPIEVEDRRVEVSPMAYKWAAAHIRRRGMSLPITAKPQTNIPCDVKKKKKKKMTKPSPVDISLFSSELFSAVKHRQFVSKSSLFVPTDSESSSGSSAKAAVGHDGDAVASALSAPERRSPPDIISAGVRKFVAQQTERTMTAKSSVQAAFILHTVFSACVRHALRYGRVEQNKKEDTGECIVLPSGPIGFPWSARLAASHLAEVAQSAAVQKELRSLLWKIVDKEHKRILRSAVELCARLSPPSHVSSGPEEDIKAANDETEAAVRSLFALSSAPLIAAQKGIDSSTALTEVDMDGATGVLSLFSEEHFVFSTTSPRLAALAKDAARRVPRDACAVNEASPETKLALLIVDMARVRMVVVLLLLFEALTQRYARLRSETEGSEDERVISAMAQKFCALTSTAGSRVLETMKHRKRFIRFFRIHLRDSEEESHATLKSVFTTITASVSKSALISPAAIATVSSDVLESDPVMRHVMRREWSATELGGSTTSATHMSSDTKPIKSATTSCDEQVKKAHLDSNKTKPQTTPHLTPAWAFRCCRTSPDTSFDPAVAVPSELEDSKLQLLRSSRDIAWPFVAEEVNASEDTQSSLRMPVTDAFAGTSTPKRHVSAVRIRYDTLWRGSGEFDERHAAQLRQIIDHRGGRVSTVNGCPPEKLRAVLRMMRKSLRLVVRFR